MGGFIQQAGTSQAASTQWINWVILWHGLCSSGVSRRECVCVCVCMRESLLPQEIVWMESFVCWRHRAFTHSAKQAGRSLAESSTCPLWWDDAQPHDLVPRVRLQVCEGEIGDVQCAVCLCMYVGVWRCRTDLQTWGVFAHFKEWHNQKLAKQLRSLKYGETESESTKHNWLDYVDQTEAFLCFCVLVVT